MEYLTLYDYSTKTSVKNREKKHTLQALWSTSLNRQYRKGMLFYSILFIVTGKYCT